MLLFIPIKEQSIRVPRKNFRTLGTLPLFLKCLKNFEKYDIVIDTDSDYIEDSCREIENVRIIRRESHLIGNDVSVNLLIKNLIDKLDVDGDKIICQTHVTSPFLSVESIDEAILYMAEYSSVCSATKIQSRFWRMESYGCCPVNHNPLVLEKTQDLPILYEENSAFYMFKVDSFIENNNRISNNHFFYAIDFPQNVDIDEEVDWNLAVAVENMLSNEVMNS